MDEEKNKTPPSTTARNISWNYFGHFCQLALNFGLTSFVVRRLSVPEYGLYLFVIFLSTTLYLLDLGVSSVLVQAYVAALSSPEKNRLGELLTTVISASAVIGAIGAVILLGVSLVLPGPFNIPREFVHEASLIFVAAAGKILFGFVSLAFEPLYQAANRFDRVNQIELAGSGLIFVCSVTVLSLGYGIAALAAVQCAAGAVQLLLSFVFLRSVFSVRQLHLRHFRWSILKNLFSQSKWTFLNNTSAFFFEVFIWTILGSFGSMREAAIFGLASKMPNHLWFLVDRGAAVCLPLMSETALNNNIDRLRKIYLSAQRLVLGLVLPFIVLGSIFAYPLIQIWAGKAYAASALVMQWLLLSVLGHAFLYTSDLLLYAAGHYRKAALISASGSIITIAVALILVPRYGAAGMAFSMAVVQLPIVCTWFTFEACKYARISFGLLASEMLRGLGLPTAILASGIWVVLVFRREISSLWLVLAGVAIGCCYFAAWGFRTALPLYRQASETPN
ncbi:MAG: oligosaccharide flippase family protein [Terracidiphilus sp.]